MTMNMPSSESMDCMTGELSSDGEETSGRFE